MRILMRVRRLLAFRLWLNYLIMPHKVRAMAPTMIKNTGRFLVLFPALYPGLVSRPFQPRNRSHCCHPSFHRNDLACMVPTIP